MDYLDRLKHQYEEAEKRSNEVVEFAKVFSFIAALEDTRNNPWEIKKRWEGKYFGFSFRMRSSKHLWGRFGGGWDWALGLKIGGTHIHLDLFVAEVTIWKVKNED